MSECVSVCACGISIYVCGWARACVRECMHAHARLSVDVYVHIQLPKRVCIITPLCKFMQFVFILGGSEPCRLLNYPHIDVTTQRSSFRCEPGKCAPLGVEQNTISCDILSVFRMALHIKCNSKHKYSGDKFRRLVNLVSHVCDFSMFMKTL